MRWYIWNEANSVCLQLNIRRSLYLFNLPQAGQFQTSNHLNAHRLPMVLSLPDVSESKGSVVQGFVTQFQAGEDLRSTEEGMRQKSGPRVRTDTCGMPSRYSLTTRCVRHSEEGWQRRDTLRNAFANKIASAEDKPVGEVSPLDITVGIGDMNSVCCRGVQPLSSQ